MWHQFIRDIFGVSESMLFGNSLVDWVGAVLVVLAVWVLLWLTRQIIAARLRRLTTENRPTAVRLAAYLIGHTKQWMILAFAVYAAEGLLSLPPHVHAIGTNVIIVLLSLQAGIWGGRTLQFYLEIKQRRGEVSGREFTSSLGIIKFVAMLLIWSLITLVALANLGVNVTALLAGLGVGGVAVALALQNVLGDLFASLAIALDKPFVVGDSLVIDACIGKVERIGIKTTRLRSESGEQIILSNADILKSRVRNFGPREERRALLTVNVDRDTPVEKLREIPQCIAGVVQAERNSRFERCHLKTLGDWALQYEISFFTRDAIATPILDLRQAVNLGILEAFRERGIKIAVPIQHVVGGAAPVDGASGG